MFFQANQLYFLTLLVGVVLLLAGLLFPFAMRFAFRLNSMEAPSGSAKTAYGCVGAFVAIVGGTLVLVLAAGPSPQERARIVSDVVQVTPREIVSADILPLERSYFANPIKRPLVVRDKKPLGELCAALCEAKRWSPNHPKAVWQCDLRLHRAEASSRCLVEKTNNNGVLLRFESGNGVRWTIGTFRSDAVGTLIERWAAEEEKRILDAKGR